MDGIDVCRQMRSGGYLGGIIMVTARAGELDRVVGLDVGADDYLAKPFGLAELLARVRALLRRSGSTPAQDDSTVTTSSGLKIDAGSRRVHLGDREIALTAKEFDVLAVLANNHDKVVPRETLMKCDPAGMAAKAAAFASPRVSGEAGQHRISQSARGSTPGRSA